MTTSLRDKMASSLGGLAETTKRQLRDIRTTAINSCSSAIKDMDMKRQFDTSTQKLFENGNKKVDELISAKQKELKS